MWSPSETLVTAIWPAKAVSIARMPAFGRALAQPFVQRISEVRARALVRIRGGQHVADLQKRGVRLGRHVFIGAGVYVDATVPWLVSIGDGSTLAPCAMVFAHDAGPKWSTGFTEVAAVNIGSRVYIGSGALVLP